MGAAAPAANAAAWAKCFASAAAKEDTPELKALSETRLDVHTTYETSVQWDKVRWDTVEASSLRKETHFSRHIQALARVLAALPAHERGGNVASQLQNLSMIFQHHYRYMSILCPFLSCRYLQQWSSVKNIWTEEFPLQVSWTQKSDSCYCW